MPTDRQGVSFEALREMLNAPRIYVMKDPEGTPDIDGLNKALLVAGIPCRMWSDRGYSEMRPPRPKLSEFLEILPQYGFMAAAAGNL